MTGLIKQLKVIFNATMLHYRAERQGRTVVSIRRVDGGLIGIHENTLYLTQ